jgi:hypothetical protein
MSHHIDRINPLLTATANTRDRRPQRPHRIERQSREGRPVGDQGNGRPRHTGHRHPEHLFAAGYAACFGASLDFAAKQQNKDATRLRGGVDRPARGGRTGHRGSEIAPKDHPRRQFGSAPLRPTRRAITTSDRVVRSPAASRLANASVTPVCAQIRRSAPWERSALPCMASTECRYRTTSAWRSGRAQIGITVRGEPCVRHSSSLADQHGCPLTCAGSLVAAATHGRFSTPVAACFMHGRPPC